MISRPSQRAYLKQVVEWEDRSELCPDNETEQKKDAATNTCFSIFAPFLSDWRFITILGLVVAT
jgi:hypothetical protein